MIDLKQLRALEAKATSGPWDACGTAQRGCRCGAVWSETVDSPVLTVTMGKWGDEFPSLRFVETGIGAKVEAYTEMIEYGEVPESEGKANALFIAALRNAAPDLLALLEEARELAEGIIGSYVSYRDNEKRARDFLVHFTHADASKE